MYLAINNHISKNISQKSTVTVLGSCRIFFLTRPSFPPPRRDLLKADKELHYFSKDF